MHAYAPTAYQAQKRLARFAARYHLKLSAGVEYIYKLMLNQLKHRYLELSSVQYLEILIGGYDSMSRPLVDL